MPHPLAVGTHRPRTRLVRMVVGPTRCAEVKAYVPARWGVGSHRLRHLFCEVMLLPLPQLVRGCRATCRSACMLLSRARTRVSRAGLLHVRPRWVCKLPPRRCRYLPARAEGGGRLPRSPLRVFPSLPRGSEARSSPGWAREWLPCRPHERACPGWFYQPQGVLVSLHGFRGNPHLGQKQAVAEHRHRKCVVVACRLQNSVPSGPNRAQERVFLCQTLGIRLALHGQQHFPELTETGARIRQDLTGLVA